MTAITAQAFAPMSVPLRLAATATPVAGQQVQWQNNDYKAGNYRFVNLSQVHVAIGFGSTPAEAQSNATGPTSTTLVNKQIIIAPLGIEIFSLGSNVYMSAAVDSGTASIVVTGGVGL